MLRRAVCLAAIAIVAAVPTSAVADNSFSAVTVPGQAVAINNDGVVVGTTLNWASSTVATEWIGSEQIDLHGDAWMYTSYPTDINDAGMVVGGYGRYTIRAICWGCASFPDNSILLDADPARFVGPAQAINNLGDIVGRGGTEGSWLWSRGAISWLGSGNDALDINDAGVIVGTHLVPGTSRVVAAMWDHGRFIELGTLPGGTRSAAVAINARGDVVGWSDEADGSVHAVLWNAGGHAIRLDGPNTLNSMASDINAHGDVVGQATIDGTSRAVVFKNGAAKMIRVGPPGGIGFSINDAGQIVGDGLDTDN